VTATATATAQRILHVNGKRVIVWPDSHEVVYPDGTRVPGDAHRDPARYSAEQIAAYAANAAADGYGVDVVRYSLEHDVCHEIVAGWFGWSSSVSLWWAAYPGRYPSGMIPWEDTIVRAFQRFLNGSVPHPILDGLALLAGRRLPVLRDEARAVLYGT